MKRYFFIIILIIILAMVVILGLNFISDSNKNTIEEALTENILEEKEIVEKLNETNETNETIASANTYENIAVNSNEKAKDSEDQMVEDSKASNTTKNTVIAKEDNKTKDTSEVKNTNKKTTNNTSEKTEDTKKSSNSQTNNEAEKSESGIVKETFDKKEEKHTHAFTVNGGWFNTENEVEAEVDKVFAEFDEKYNNGELTWEEYVKKCPTGYETFRCSCGMFGLNFSYRN